MANRLTAEIIAELHAPFPPNFVEWRPGGTIPDKKSQDPKAKKAQPLAYVDPRRYEARLTAVVGGDWEVHFHPWGENRIVCELTVCGVTRSSTGEFVPEAEEEGQGQYRKKNVGPLGTKAEAQAFKRTAAKFGLGAFFYNLPLPFDLQYLPIEFSKFTREGKASLDKFYREWYSRNAGSVGSPEVAVGRGVGVAGVDDGDERDDDIDFGGSSGSDGGGNAGGRTPDPLIEFAQGLGGVTVPSGGNGKTKVSPAPLGAVAAAGSNGVDVLTAEDRAMIASWTGSMDATGWAKKVLGLSQQEVGAAWNTANTIHKWTRATQAQTYEAFVALLRRPA